MNDEQFNALAALLTDIAQSLGRMAPEPYFERPLSDYSPEFNWNSIGAYVVESDRDGATRIARNDLIYYRRRGNNEDFGAAVWFSRPTGEKPAEGEKAVYHVLIKFRDRKVKRLNDETRDSLDGARKQAPAPAAPPQAHNPPVSGPKAPAAPRPAASTVTVKAPAPAAPPADPSGLFKRPVKVQDQPAPAAPPASAPKPALRQAPPGGPIKAQPNPVIDKLDPRDDTNRVAIPVGSNNANLIREAFEKGATIRDAAEAVGADGMNGGTVYYSVCRRFIVAHEAMEQTRKAHTDAAGRVDWPAAVLALAGVIEPMKE